jgi:hypothetical protein
MQFLISALQAVSSYHSALAARTACCAAGVVVFLFFAVEQSALRAVLLFANFFIHAIVVLLSCFTREYPLTLDMLCRTLHGS